MYLLGLLLPTLVMALLGSALVSSGRARREARSWTPPAAPAARRPVAVPPSAVWGGSAADPRPVPQHRRPPAPTRPPSSGGTPRLVIGIVLLVLAGLSVLGALGQLAGPH